MSVILYPLQIKKLLQEGEKQGKNPQKAKYDLLVSPIINSTFFPTMKTNAALSAITCYIVALSTSGFLQILK